jgi:hypothetical protein
MIELLRSLNHEKSGVADQGRAAFTAFNTLSSIHIGSAAGDLTRSVVCTSHRSFRARPDHLGGSIETFPADRLSASRRLRVVGDPHACGDHCQSPIRLARPGESPGRIGVSCDATAEQGKGRNRPARLTAATLTTPPPSIRLRGKCIADIAPNFTSLSPIRLFDFVLAVAFF